MAKKQGDGPPSRRILWVDDEVDHLRPHVMRLEDEGYRVETVMNGADALDLLRAESYDLVLLDEQMPGLRGVEVLAELRSGDPRLPVVMVTKSEDEETLDEAIGRRADDYIVKPTSPHQVLSVVRRLLEGEAIRHEHVSRDFSRRFGELQRAVARADSWDAFAELFGEMVDWELRLEESGETGLRESLENLVTDLRREYCDLVEERYAEWVHAGGEEGPPLSVDVVRHFLAPLLEPEEPVLLVVVDCLRLDQWRAILPLVSETFEVEETLYASLLPTATPFSRNAIFGGLFPDELEERHPGWWERGAEEGYNTFEDELFARHLREVTGRSVPTHFEKVFTADQGEGMLARLPGYLAEPAATALVFGFVDLLTHGRSESQLVWEMARDATGLRSLTVNWFERSAAREALRIAADRGVRVLFTTDHGSLHCRRPATIYAKSDVTPNLRYKFGDDLRVEDPRAVLAAAEADALRLPPGGMRTKYLLCRDDYYFVYPTKLREYQKRYADSFLHGGVSPEEMVVPAALLTPR